MRGLSATAPGPTGSNLGVRVCVHECGVCVNHSRCFNHKTPKGDGLSPLALLPLFPTQAKGTETLTTPIRNWGSSRPFSSLPRSRGAAPACLNSATPPCQSFSGTPAPGVKHGIQCRDFPRDLAPRLPGTGTQSPFRGLTLRHATRGQSSHQALEEAETETRANTHQRKRNPEEPSTKAGPQRLPV